MDDPGELTLQWLQPEVDVEIDATLTDEDGGDSPATSTTDMDRGYRSKVADPEVGIDFHWNEIADGAPNRRDLYPRSGGRGQVPLGQGCVYGYPRRLRRYQDRGREIGEPGAGRAG